MRSAESGMDDTLHLEIVQTKRSRESEERIRELVTSYFSDLQWVTPGSVVGGKELARRPELAAHVESVTVGEAGADAAPAVRWADVPHALHVFRLEDGGPEADDDAPAAVLRALPARELHGLWESLVFDSRIKVEALAYAATVLRLAARGVDPHLVACNRVLLLHGPPGCGKTSLCRALAHKLAARLRDRYPRAVLVEVDAPGLFSKWFSESGRLIARLFGRVRELLADPELLVLVLVDEVESLAHARSAGGTEPSDAMRAVNAALAQLDALRTHGNALLLATSNLPGAMDVAFLDRADVRLRVGPPGPRAARLLLHSAAEELMRAGVVLRESLLPAAMLEARTEETDATRGSLALRTAAERAARAGLSGRALRRLPLLALARLPQGAGEAVSLSSFLDALLAALEAHLVEAGELPEDNQIQTSC